LILLDSGFLRNDEKGNFLIFCEFVNVGMLKYWGYNHKYTI